MVGLGGDLRYALRMLQRNPGLALTAALVLALAIGASAVAISFVNSVLLRPLPVFEPERLVRLYTTYTSGPRYFTLGPSDYLHAAGLQQVFSGVLADEPAPVHFRAGGRQERVWAYNVSANYFAVLGLQSARGRFFRADEAGAPVVVLSHSFWRRRFGGDPRILGTTVALGTQPFTVIGVAPEGFHGVQVGLRPELFVPVRVQDRGERGYFVMARLRPGVAVEEARAALAVLARRLEESDPVSRRGVTFSVLPELEGGVHPLARDAFVAFGAMLATAVGLVLLLACANVAGLLLARAVFRRREIAVRLAVGASRHRIVQQLLIESGLLWLIAGAAGTGLAIAATRVLAATPLPTDRPLFVDVGVDGRVLALTAGATALTGIVFGLVPALAATRRDVIGSLREGGRALGFRSLLRSTLVAGQVALCIVLLVGAGLSVRSLSNAHRIDLGFEAEGVVMASLDLEGQGYDDRRAAGFWRELAARVSAEPGVASVSFTNRVPFELNIIRLPVAAPGQEDRGLPSVDFAVVDRSYFETMRIPLRQGRVFSENEDADPAEVVINETLARQLWPGGGILDRPLMVGGSAYRVVGLVKDGKYLTLGEEPTPFVYLPFRGEGPSAMTVVVRVAARASRDGLAPIVARLQQEIARLDPELPAHNLKTLREHLAIALVPVIVGASVLGLFGGLALLLACVGLYGLLASAVAHRTHEIGIRRALGARDRDVFGLVVRQSMAPVLAGLGGGLGLGLLASPVMRTLLHGIGPDDPVAYGGAVLVLLFTAAVACGLPASRATRVEPMKLLREE
jgi:putative ABC transport system permease protein